MVRKPPRELNIVFVLTTAESRAKIWQVKLSKDLVALAVYIQRQ